MLRRILTGSIVCVLAASLCIGAIAAPAVTVSPDNISKLYSAPDSTVIATMGGVKITKGELMRKLWLWDSAKELNDMLVEQYITNEAKKAKVSVTQKEIDAKIAEAVRQSGSGSLKDLLARSGYTKDYVHSRIKVGILADKIVRARTKVTPAQLSQYIKASHILIRFDTKETDLTKRDADAKKKAEDVAAKIKAGEDFAKLAREMSDDPGSKATGGDLGWFTKGRMVGDFETAAYKLNVGEVSEPVKTTFGYHIIKLTGKGTEAKGADLAKLKKEITDSQLNQGMPAFFNQATTAARKANKLMLPPPPPPKMPPMMMPPPEGEGDVPPPPDMDEGTPPAPDAGEAAPAPDTTETAPAPAPAPNTEAAPAPAPDAGEAPPPPPAPGQ